jgi:hypothetical protein
MLLAGLVMPSQARGITLARNHHQRTRPAPDDPLT